MLNRNIAPPVNQLEDFSLPQSEKVTLPNGSELYSLVNTTQPVIRLEIVFEAGKWYEPSKGVSFFTSKLLMEGTKTKSAKEIANILDFYGASLECNQGFDWATLTLYCLSKHYHILLPLVEEILTEATFPETEFKLLKQRTIQNLQVERKKPAYLAMEQMTKNIYGPDHPYISGLEAESIERLNLDDIKSFYNKHYNLANAKIFICGAISGQDEEITKGLCNNFKASTFLSENHTLLASINNDVITIPDSLQSAIRIGKEFPLINHPDYLQLTVVNKILGGYFGSRLMKNIREDKGYTYGIYSSLSVRKHSTLFYIGSEVKVDKALDTIKEVDYEIGKLKNETISDEELTTVKNFIIGKFLNDSTTVFDQMDRLKHLILYNLPADHYSTYIKTIKNFSSKDLTILAQKYLIGLNCVNTTNH